MLRGLTAKEIAMVTHKPQLNKGDLVEYKVLGIFPKLYLVSRVLYDDTVFIGSVVWYTIPYMMDNCKRVHISRLKLLTND